MGRVGSKGATGAGGEEVGACLQGLAGLQVRAAREAEEVQALAGVAPLIPLAARALAMAAVGSHSAAHLPPFLGHVRTWNSTQSALKILSKRLRSRVQLVVISHAGTSTPSREW